MIKVPTENGEITISDAVFTTITGAAATNCFGVKGMAGVTVKAVNVCVDSVTV